MRFRVEYMSVRSRINYIKMVIPMGGEGLIIGIMIPKDTVKCNFEDFSPSPVKVLILI